MYSILRLPKWLEHVECGELDGLIERSDRDLDAEVGHHERSSWVSPQAKNWSRVQVFRDVLTGAV
jgi:hypothetical protein